VECGGVQEKRRRSAGCRGWGSWRGSKCSGASRHTQAGRCPRLGLGLVDRPWGESKCRSAGIRENRAVGFCLSVPGDWNKIRVPGPIPPPYPFLLMIDSEGGVQLRASLNTLVYEDLAPFRALTRF